MIALSIIQPVFDNLFLTGLVKNIYHDVIIWEEKDNRYPAYRKGKELAYVGVTDKKVMSCYLRQISDISNHDTQYVGSNKKIYLAQIVYRLVFFNCHEERNFDYLYASILNIAFGDGIEFVALIRDKKKLLASESNPRNFSFDGNTFYAALDFRVTFKLRKNECEQDISSCDVLPNPLCQ